MQPMISVIIPAYNCAARIGFMLDSLERQTYKNSELIIVDDGSTDATAETLRRLKESGRFPRLTLLGDGKNHGVSWARNAGFDAARGECVIFLDADDMLEPEFLERLHARLTEKNADYAACGFREYDIAAGKYKEYPLNIPEDITPLRLLAGCITEEYSLGYLWVILFKREYLAKNKLYSHVGATAMQDRELLIKALACLGRGTFIPDELYIYVQHDGMSRRRNNTTPAKRYRRYHDKAYVELREADFVLRRVDDPAVRSAARDCIRVSAWHRILAMCAMRRDRRRFDRLLKKSCVRRLLLSGLRYPKKNMKSAILLLCPSLFYAHYSSSRHAVKS